MKTLFNVSYYFGAAAIAVCIALLILAVFVSWTRAEDVMTSPVPVSKPVAPWSSPLPKVKP